MPSDGISTWFNQQCNLLGTFPCINYNNIYAVLITMSDSDKGSAELCNVLQ